MENLSPGAKLMYELLMIESTEEYERRFLEYKKAKLDAVKQFVDDTGTPVKDLQTTVDSVPGKVEIEIDSVKAALGEDLVTSSTATAPTTPAASHVVPNLKLDTIGNDLTPEAQCICDLLVDDSAAPTSTISDVSDVPQDPTVLDVDQAAIAIDTLSFTAPMPVTCSMQGRDHNTCGEDVVVMPPPPGSVPTSVISPPEYSPSPSLEPWYVLEQARMPPTTCSAECAASNIRVMTGRQYIYEDSGKLVQKVDISLIQHVTAVCEFLSSQAHLFLSCEVIQTAAPFVCLPILQWDENCVWRPPFSQNALVRHLQVYGQKNKCSFLEHNQSGVFLIAWLFNDTFLEHGIMFSTHGEVSLSISEQVQWEIAWSVASLSSDCSVLSYIALRLTCVDHQKGCASVANVLGIVCYLFLHSQKVQTERSILIVCSLAPNLRKMQFNGKIGQCSSIILMSQGAIRYGPLLEIWVQPLPTGNGFFYGHGSEQFQWKIAWFIAPDYLAVGNKLRLEVPRDPGLWRSGELIQKLKPALSLALHLLVLVVMRKEAVFWPIFQSTSRGTILLLPWDPGASRYGMGIKFQVELEQKWMVSLVEQLAITTFPAMPYTIHHHFPSGNLMLLNTAAANSDIVTYLHSSGPPASDEFDCVASKNLVVPNASTSPVFSFTRIGMVVTFPPGLDEGQDSNMFLAVCPGMLQTTEFYCKRIILPTTVSSEGYFEKRSAVLPPFSPRTVQASLQVNWPQLYHTGNYGCHYRTSNKASTCAFHSSACVAIWDSSGMNLGQGELSWDPGIRALLSYYDGDYEQVHGVDQIHIGHDYYLGHVLCFYEFFAQAAAEGGIMFEARTYCYSHYIAPFLVQGLFSHDYYINLVQVHLDHIYDIGHRCHHDPGKLKESHVPWDPGGSTWSRLEVKPNFMEGGLSATPSILSMGWVVGCHMLGLGPQASNGEKATTSSRGTATTNGAWNGPAASAWKARIG